MRIEELNWMDVESYLKNDDRLILVIGDKMSANTKRLTELCASTGTETHQIQNAAELKAQWLAGKNKIGLTAGASTPEWVINEVLHKIRDRR